MRPGIRPDAQTERSLDPRAPIRLVPLLHFDRQRRTNLCQSAQSLQISCPSLLLCPACSWLRCLTRKQLVQVNSSC